MFLETLQNSQENTCARISFLIKPQACNFIKKRLWRRCFPGKSGQMRTGGGEVVSHMWTSAWKKNYSYHICEIYSDNYAVCLYIKFSFCLYSIKNVEIFVWPIIMPVCHIYLVVNPIFWNAIIEIV